MPARLSLLTALLAVASAAQTPLYQNPEAPVDRRVDDLLSLMTLEEKASQMLSASPAIDRLGVPAYDWWNECLHGVARAGVATVFPQPIGMAATFDTDLFFRVATAISDEVRAKHREFVRQGRRGIYEGLTFWTPNINLFRDPRWGRGMETYGEGAIQGRRRGPEHRRARRRRGGAGVSREDRPIPAGAHPLARRIRTRAPDLCTPPRRAW